MRLIARHVFLGYGGAETMADQRWDDQPTRILSMSALGSLLNGAFLVASDAECVLTMEGLSGGTISEAEFGAWIRRSLRLSRP